MYFENIEDEKFFDKLLEKIGGLEKNKRLFDFRDPNLKRNEFNKICKPMFTKLVKKYGNSCQLCCHDDCELEATEIDHLIPLSSNELNKHLRGMKGSSGKKTPSQSFGSNHITNLVLACKRCNAFKKHRFPSEKIIRHIKQLQETLCANVGETPYL